ncbi:MAG: amino acid permease [[Clostridium] symbiosum]|uniref:APC family permease n=1 Tax=Clostridium symbiosum TaxID=1512 RepID=UPI00241E5968|nr:amino acid permease [[Clostridium] symbiosum]
MTEGTVLKKVLGFRELLSVGIGQTIGSGVMAYTGIAIGITGRGVVLAYIMSSLLVILITLPAAQLSSTLPCAGAEYMHTSRILSPTLGTFYMFIYIIYTMTISVYAISFTEYLQQLIPSIPFKLIAVLVLTVFYIANIVGIQMAAAIQKILVIALFAGLFVFIIFGLPHVQISGFTADTMFPAGFKSVFGAAALLTFATGGANVITHLGAEAKNPGRDIPIVMAVATVLVGIIYAFLAFVASGVLPVEEVANKNLGVVAGVFLSKPAYLFFMIGGAMTAIITTLNSTFSWVTKPLLMFVEDGYLPKKLGEVNRRFGTPHYLLTVFYIVGLLPVITGVSLSAISTIGSCAMLFRVFIPICSCFFVHKKYPDACAKSFFLFKPSVLCITVGIAGVILLIQMAVLLDMQTTFMIYVSLVTVLCAFIISVIVNRIRKVSFYTGDAVNDFRQTSKQNSEN